MKVVELIRELNSLPANSSDAKVMKQPGLSWKDVKRVVYNDKVNIVYLYEH